MPRPKRCQASQREGALVACSPGGTSELADLDLVRRLRSRIPSSSRCATVSLKLWRLQALVAQRIEARSLMRFQQLGQVQFYPHSAALSVDHKPEYAEWAVAGLRGKPAWDIYRRLDLHFAPEERAQAGLDLVGRQTEDHAVALPAPIERHHKAGSISGSPEPCNPKAERSVPASNHGPAFLGDLAGRLPEKRAIGEQPNITGWRFGKQLADCDLVVVICHVDGAGARSQILDRPARSSGQLGGERHLPHPECSR